MACKVLRFNRTKIIACQDDSYHGLVLLRPILRSLAQSLVWCHAVEEPGLVAVEDIPANSLVTSWIAAQKQQGRELEHFRPPRGAGMT